MTDLDLEARLRRVKTDPMTRIRYEQGAVFALIVVATIALGIWLSALLGWH